MFTCFIVKCNSFIEVIKFYNYMPVRCTHMYFIVNKQCPSILLVEEILAVIEIIQWE